LRAPAALAGHPVALAPRRSARAGTADTAADRLSGLFLVIAFGAAAPVSLVLRELGGPPARPGRRGRRGLGASYSLSLGAVA